MLLWRDCLCPRDVAAVGSNQMCGMGVMRQNDGIWQWLIQRNRVQWYWTRFLCVETESNGLSFFALKPSPKDSVSALRKRVQWTRFLCMETESFGLGFYVQKPSPLDSVSMERKQVLWTRFLSIETESIGLDFYVSPSANSERCVSSLPSHTAGCSPQQQHHVGINSPSTAASLPNPPRGITVPPTSRGSQLIPLLEVLSLLSSQNMNLSFSTNSLSSSSSMKQVQNTHRTLISHNTLR